MKKYKITSTISKRIYKIIDFFFKDKDRNYQIKKNIRKFARFTIKNIFHFFRIRFLYYFYFKKNLADLLPKTTRLNNHTRYYDVYSVLESLIEKKKIKKILEIGIGGTFA